MVAAAEDVIAAYNVVAAVNFVIWCNVETYTNVHHAIAANAAQLHNPVLKIWGLNTEKGDVPVISELIEQNVDIVVKMIEETAAYKEAQVILTHDELKNWIRKPITQYFIDSDVL